MQASTIKKIIGSVVAVLAGGVFVFSAVTKLMPIEAFEISLVDIGFVGFKTAPVFARLLIGLEFIVAFLLMAHFKLRKFTIPFAAQLLVVFSVYIVYLLKTYGNRGSCGCFGTVLEITPMEGLLKNAALLLLLMVPYFWAPAFEFKNKSFGIGLGIVALTVLPFLVNPMGNPFSTTLMSDYNQFPLDTATVYQNATEKITPATDLGSGKHIVAFLSATCEHCRLAAKKLVVFKKQSPSLPMIFVLYNNKEKLPEFFADTKADSIPHILMGTKDGFLKVTDRVFPRIYWVNNGRVMYETNFYQLDREEMDKWVSGK